MRHSPLTMRLLLNFDCPSRFLFFVVVVFFVFFVADEMLKHFLSCSTLIALIAADVKIPSG